MHFTLFKEDVIYMTSIRDENGNRANGVKCADAHAADAVLNRGETVIVQNEIFGEPSMTAYWPVREIDGEIVGMWAIAKPLAEQNRETANVLAIVIFCSAGIMLFFALTAGILGNRIARPIRKATDYAVQVAGGNLDVSLDVRNRGEVGLLVSALRTMVATLKVRILEAENLNALAQQDIEEKKKMLLDNELQLTKLNLVVQSNKIGLWEMEVRREDPANPVSVVKWSDEFRHLLGFTDENDFPDLVSSFNENTHPEDVERTNAAFFAHFLDTTGQTPYDVECRMIKKNGEYIYIHATGETIRDENGNPVYVAGAIRDITESKNLIQEADAQRKEAETANSAKSAFLSTMSHEIRTPMNAILGISEIQLQNDALEPSIRDGLEKIYTSGDMLLGIINDILDLSKIEAGKLELMIHNYETASLISDTAQLNMMRIGSKPIEFELMIDENLPAVISGDELRVKQILNNVLSNAFKYTARGTVKMSVSAKAIDGVDDEIMLIVSVSDTGQGMSKEQVDKLFDEYSRFNSEANRTTEGTGLGMSITRNLIHMMNGELAIESEPGKGSVFTVRLPQKKVNSDILGKEMAENLHRFRTSSRAQMKRAQIMREPMPYGSVLIVDDVETNIFVAKGLMSPYELRIDSADSGFGAIEKIKNGSVYDIIFMDHMMPKMDGVETTKILREMGYDKPIVALTANAVAGQADIFLGNGFADFISKPIDIRQLNAVLNKLIRDKRPPEVIEASNRREAQTEQAGVYAPMMEMDPILVEIVVRDVNRSLRVLDAFMEKGAPYNEKEVRTYTIHTHGIKSALANIGRMDISAVALKLEQLGRDNNIEAIIKETPAFLNSLRAFVAEVTPQEKMAASEPENEDKLYLKEKLLEIKTACEEYDDAAAEEILKELRNNKWTQPVKELFNKIAEKLLHSDFDEIIDIINDFLTLNIND